MLHDGEIDMEELEARLYSQVYHSSEIDAPMSEPTTIKESLGPTMSRYFDSREMPPPPSSYSSRNIHRVFHRHSNDKEAYFQSNQNANIRLYSNSANFYDSVGLFPYPAVNNIVVLPQPPTQIFNSPLPQPSAPSKTRRSTLKRKERRRRAKERWKAEKIEKTFKKHNLTNKPADLKQKNDEINVVEETKDDEVICLTESDSSDCEINETLVPEIVLSSDDEVDVQELKKVALKNEINEPKEFEIKPVELSIDDDVLVIEPSFDILTISDETQSLTDVNTSIGSNDRTLVAQPELIDTPESTNDFLDNSFSVQHSVESESTPRLNVNDFESDSNCSASDVDVLSGSGIFSVQEFDVPSKNSLSELNLDSFTSYIGSKASTSIPSILTPMRNPTNCMGIGSKSKASSKNSSDSSSESDYEDKVGLVQSDFASKQKVNTPNRKSSSESDDCLIINNSSKELVTLSPITSDEETTSKTNESRLKQNKVAEKRKLVDTTDMEIKKVKPSDERSANLQETNTFFSSSSDSEVEAVDNADLSSEHFDVELLNVGSSSTPVKQLRDVSATKPQSFSEYWTDDMKKFYEQSWGHENFSIEEAQKSMSDNPSMWKIIYKDEANYQMLPKGPRCFRCREHGHRATNCYKETPVPKCILCGGSGHQEARCPKQFCTSCGRRSYYSTTYCSRCVNLRHSICKICRVTGHPSSNCPDLWRRYHLTKTSGPLKKPADLNLKPPCERWCSGCASHGHFEFNCNYYNRTHLPINPIVHRYEDIYGKQENRTEQYEHGDRSQRFEENRMERYEHRTETDGRVEMSQRYGGQQQRRENESQRYENNSQQEEMMGRRDERSQRNEGCEVVLYGEGLPGYENISQRQEERIQNQDEELRKSEAPKKTYYSHPHQISPWMNTYEPPNQLPVQNFIHTPATNANFYQQFPVFQSLPNIFNLQPKLHNIFSINSVPSTSQAETYPKKNVVAEIVPDSNPNPAQVVAQPTKRDFLKLKDAEEMRQLLSKDGLDFLKKLSMDLNAKIKIIKRRKKRKFTYWCMMEGAREQLLNVKEAIGDYIGANVEVKPIDAMEIFRGKEFSVPVLRQSLNSLDDRNTDWSKVASKLNHKVKETQRKIIAEELKENVGIERINELEAILKKQCTALNAIMLGKVDVAEGCKHMEVLKEGLTGREQNNISEERLKDSYNYIFKNYSAFNWSHNDISRLFQQGDTKAKIDELFHCGSSLCKDNQLLPELRKFKSLYKNAASYKYSPRSIGKFKSFYNKIRRMAT